MVEVVWDLLQLFKVLMNAKIMMMWVVTSKLQNLRVINFTVRKHQYLFKSHHGIEQMGRELYVSREKGEKDTVIRRSLHKQFKVQFIFP